MWRLCQACLGRGERTSKHEWAKPLQDLRKILNQNADGQIINTNTPVAGTYTTMIASSNGMSFVAEYKTTNPCHSLQNTKQHNNNNNNNTTTTTTTTQQHNNNNWHAMACLGMPWHVLACHGMQWHALACRGMPWQCNLSPNYGQIRISRTLTYTEASFLILFQIEDSIYV